ncbi:hypothetical protein GCM10028812_17560 [Ancylobacter sonchi]
MTVFRPHGTRILCLAFLVALSLAGGGRPAAAQSCPNPPPLPKRVEVRMNPTLAPGSDALKQKQDEYDDGIANIRRFTALVGRLSDDAVTKAAKRSAAATASGDPRSVPFDVGCINDILQQEGREDSLLVDKPRQMRSGYELQWAVAGMSLAAFKLQRAGIPLSPDSLSWLTQLAREVMEFHDRHTQLNNHILWAALGVGTTGYLAGQPDLVQWANGRVSLSLADTQPDGTLPREMSRGPKASHYHFFAAMPVMVYGDIRSCFGDPMPADERATLAKLDGALHRILADPQWLAPRAGQPQLPVSNPGWLDAMDGGQLPASLRDHASARTGGQLSTLFTALSCAR